MRKLLREETKKADFEYLTQEKEKQDKIKNLEFEKLTVQDFLCSDKIERTRLSRLIHNLLAKTIDMKENNPWNYVDNSCICEEKAETQSHMYVCSYLKSWLEISESKSGSKYSDLFCASSEEKVKEAIIF